MDGCIEAAEVVGYVVLAALASGGIGVLFGLLAGGICNSAHVADEDTERAMRQRQLAEDIIRILDEEAAISKAKVKGRN